jgi:hypothetical protein
MSDVSRNKRASGEFVRGFKSHTPIVLVVAMLTACGLLAGLEWFVASGAFTVIPERSMLRIANDDYVHVSYRMAELKKNPPAGQIIYLFGGSSTMDMMRSERSLANAITTPTGHPLVVSLANHAQSLGQTLALVDNLPPKKALLAIGISPNRFTASPLSDEKQLEGAPIAVTSSRLAAALKDHVPSSRRPSGVLRGVLDFTFSYVKQRASLTKPWLSSLTYSNHYAHNRASLSAKIAGSRQTLSHEKESYRANADYNLALLADVVHLARERGFTVVFFEQPLAPEASGPGWGRFLARYKSDVSALAKQLNVVAIRVGPQAGLTTNDFGDMFHLVDSGRDKWTPPLGKALARVMTNGSAAGL